MLFGDFAERGETVSRTNQLPFVFILLSRFVVLMSYHLHGHLGLRVKVPINGNQARLHRGGDMQVFAKLIDDKSDIKCYLMGGVREGFGGICEHSGSVWAFVDYSGLLGCFGQIFARFWLVLLVAMEFILNSSSSWLYCLFLLSFACFGLLGLASIQCFPHVGLIFRSCGSA